MKSTYLVVSIYIAVFYGYAANIVKLASSIGPVVEWGGTEVIRALGVFAVPLGVVMGYL